MERDVKICSNELTVSHDLDSIDHDVKWILVEMKVTWFDGNPREEGTSILASRSTVVNCEERPVSVAQNGYICVECGCEMVDGGCDGGTAGILMKCPACGATAWDN